MRIEKIDQQLLLWNLKKNSTFYSAAQWDLWSWNRNSPFHPWPHKSTFPEVLEKWPRTKWKANIAGVSHCSKILNFVQKKSCQICCIFRLKIWIFFTFFLGWLTLYRLKWVEFTNSLDLSKSTFWTEIGLKTECGVCELWGSKSEAASFRVWISRKLGFLKNGETCEDQARKNWKIGKRKNSAWGNFHVQTFEL